MKILKIISFGLTFYKLNKQLVGEGRVIMDEGMDVLKSIGTSKSRRLIRDAIKIFKKELNKYNLAIINEKYKSH